MPLIRLAVISALLASSTALPLAKPATGAEPWHWPTGTQQKPVILRGFEAPARRYGAGHRGVDLAAPAGAQIFAPADGVVAFVGVVARIPIVVLDHGGRLRTTYQPLVSGLHAGERVLAGEMLGKIAKTQFHCLPAGCLHWGIRNSAGYLDPLRFVHPSAPVLLPLLR